VKILKEQLLNAAGAVGTMLLPRLKELTKWINDRVDDGTFGSIGEAIKKGLEGIDTILAGIEDELTKLFIRRERLEADIDTLRRTQDLSRQVAEGSIFDQIKAATDLFFGELMAGRNPFKSPTEAARLGLRQVAGAGDAFQPEPVEEAEARADEFELQNKLAEEEARKAEAARKKQEELDRIKATQERQAQEAAAQERAMLQKKLDMDFQKVIDAQLERARRREADMQSAVEKAAEAAQGGPIQNAFMGLDERFRMFSTMQDDTAQKQLTTMKQQLDQQKKTVRGLEKLQKQLEKGVPAKAQ
jgi:flagellar biosynthesis GTPase FlhF